MCGAPPSPTMTSLVDGRAAASEVVAPMVLRKPTPGTGAAQAAGRPDPLISMDGDELKKVLQTVSGTRGSMHFVAKVVAKPEQSNDIHVLVDGVLSRAEQVFSLWVPDSEVNRINKAPRAEPIELSEDMSGVLSAVQKLHGLTKGVYDPACFPLLQHYKQHLKQSLRGFDVSSLDNDPQAAAIAMYANWGAFILAKDSKTLTKAHDAAGLDLGGIAKGWAIDQCVDALRKAGFKDIFMEWGGDVRVSGKHPTGRPWTVSVTEPPSMQTLHRTIPTPSSLQRQESLRRMSVSSGMGPSPRGGPGLALPGRRSMEMQETEAALSEQMASLNCSDDEFRKVLANIPLRDGASITTSGDYMQVFWVGDRLFHHVFQSKTKRLMEVSTTGLAQTSVVTDGPCMYADALATTALAMGAVPKNARKFLDTVSPLSGGAPVTDYLLYVRDGPKVLRRRVRGSEDETAQEIRLSQHKPARVIVVGGGLAGFSAAIEAAKSGARVILLEKESRVGGNSAKATSGINGWGTLPQAREGIMDEEKYFERDTFRSGKGGMCDPSLIRVLSTQSAEAVRWLMDDLGVDLAELSQLGGHAFKRTHRARPTPSGDPRPIGWLIMERVQAFVKERLPPGQVDIRTSARVVKLEVEGNHEAGRCAASLPPLKTVTGVTYEDMTTGKIQTLSADAVVLTTGGYGCDLTPNSLLKEHRPDLLGSEANGNGGNGDKSSNVSNGKGLNRLGMPSTNGAFATGDGVKMGLALGALTVDMDKVQLHPTSFVDPKDPLNPTKILGPEALRGSGGILVNHEGQRFVNELDLRSVVSNAILKQCQPYKCKDGQEGNIFAWCILNQEAQKKFGSSSLRFYKDARGLFEGAKDFPTLAKEVIGCNPEVLKATLEEYAQAASISVDVRTRKNAFPCSFSWTDTDLLAARVTPSIHYTMGGLRISAATEVLEDAQMDQGNLYRKLRPVRRLFAAGEVTGGVHGANRLGGNSLLECVVFGRLAGERAGTVKQKQSTCLVEDEWTPVTFREMLQTDSKYGINTKVFRFHLHGALQQAGLAVGQFVAIRGELDGEWLQGYYSPLSRPHEEGYVEILCRTDTAGGQIINFLNAVRPGGECYLKAMGGLRLRFEGSQLFHGEREIKKLSLLAGGTGIAPMIQIVRAYLYHLVGAGAPSGEPLLDPTTSGVRLVYASEQEFDLAFTDVLQSIQDTYPAYFQYYIVLNHPPLGWTEGVGFVNEDTARRKLFYPYEEEQGQLFVMCGPPIFEMVMGEMLVKIGVPRHAAFAYSNP